MDDEVSGDRGYRRRPPDPDGDLLPQWCTGSSVGRPATAGHGTRNKSGVSAFERPERGRGARCYPHSPME